MANDLVPYSQALSDPATTASSLESTDVIAIAREDSDRPTGFKSMVTRLLTLAKKIVSGIDYSTELTETDAKTITGAINEVAQNSGSVDITTAIDTPASVQTFNDGGNDIPVKKLEVAIDANLSGITEVNIVRSGKNIFDGVSYLDAYIASNNLITSLSGGGTVYALCKPNTTYTISKTAGTRFIVAYTTELPDISVDCYGKIQDSTASNITITTGNDAKYIIAFVFNPGSDSGTRQSMIDSVQIEEGLYATTYETPDVVTKTISLGETLTQGGTLEAVSGLLTRTDTTTKQLTGINVPTKTGINKVFADTGNIELIEYFNENGNDIDSLVDLEVRLSGRIRTKTYTGDGSVPLVVTFDEVPTMILNIFGNGQGSQVIAFPFVYGLTSFGGVYVTPNPWTPPTQAGGNHLLYKVAYSNGGKTMTVRASAGDVGAQFNQNGDTYTIYYLV